MATWRPSIQTGQFDSLNTLDMSVGVSGGFFPIHRNLSNKKGKKGKMADKNASFRVVVKNGDQQYDYDNKSGQYKYKTVDYVYESNSLGDALREFLDYVNDEYNEDKVSLTVVPAKKKEKK